MPKKRLTNLALMAVLAVLASTAANPQATRNPAPSQPERAVDMVEMYGLERIMANSAGDWGVSNPMNMPDFIRTLRARGFDNDEIHRIVYDNPLRFLSQAKRFNFDPPLPVLSK